MNVNVSDQKEILTKSPEEQLEEFKKRALADGVPHANLNEYLLHQDYVPELVKQLIRKEFVKDYSQPQPQAEQMMPRPEASTVPEQPGETEATDGLPKAESQNRGEVEVPTSAKEIQKIKEQYAKERESDETSEAGAGQTAEKKEATSTSATQNTDDGVSQRISMASQGVFGYQPSPQIASDAEDIASKGNVKESRTWQATVMQRLIGMWGSISGLFNQ